MILIDINKKGQKRMFTNQCFCFWTKFFRNLIISNVFATDAQPEPESAICPSEKKCSTKSIIKLSPWLNRPIIAPITSQKIIEKANTLIEVQSREAAMKLIIELEYRFLMKKFCNLTAKSKRSTKSAFQTYLSTICRGADISLNQEIDIVQLWNYLSIIWIIQSLFSLIQTKNCSLETW